jgi:hypothetical protein
MASDDQVAAALNVFAKDVRRISRNDPGPTVRLSPAQEGVRRQRLEQLAVEVETLATDPRSATYQSFERILKQVEELGASPTRETIISVASAFLQRTYVSPSRQGRATSERA